MNSTYIVLDIAAPFWLELLSIFRGWENIYIFPVRKLNLWWSLAFLWCTLFIYKEGTKACYPEHSRNQMSGDGIFAFFQTTLHSKSSFFLVFFPVMFPLCVLLFLFLPVPSLHLLLLHFSSYVYLIHNFTNQCPKPCMNYVSHSSVPTQALPCACVWVGVPVVPAGMFHKGTQLLGTLHLIERQLLHPPA